MVDQDGYANYTFAAGDDADGSSLSSDDDFYVYANQQQTTISDEQDYSSAGDGSCHDNVPNARADYNRDNEVIPTRKIRESFRWSLSNDESHVCRFLGDTIRIYEYPALTQLSI